VQEEERIWIRQHLTEAESAQPLLVQNIRKVRSQIRTSFGDASKLSEALDKDLQLSLRKYAAEVNRERERLSQYETALKSELANSKAFAREHGYELFRSASGELRGVVLEADVGLIDVSWERKYKESTRIQTLMDERNQRLKELDQSLEEITRDRNTGLVSPKTEEEDNASEGGL
jgi:hypothetical protein